MSNPGPTNSFVPPALVIDAEGSTASKADLLDKCSHSALYPKPGFESSDAANHGNAFHWVAEQIVVAQNAGEEPDEASLILAACASYSLDIDSTGDLYDEVGQWLDYYGDTLKGSELEVSLAYNLYDGTVRRLGHHRSYEARKPGDLCMTIDQFQVLPGNGGKYAVVRDWKTGKQLHTNAARDNMQLAICGLAVAKLFDLNKVVVVKAHVTPTGVYEDAYEIGEFALAHAIPDACKRIFLAKPSDPNPGPHCTGMFCPAIAVCPAAQQAVEAIPVDIPANDNARHLPIVATSAAITSDTHCASIINRLKLAEKMMEKAWDAVQEYVGDRNIKAGDGWEYGKVEETRRSVEVSEDALDVLRHHFGDEVSTMQKRSIPLTAIKEAAGKLAKGKARTAMEAKVYKDLRSVGALREAKRSYFKIKKVGEGE